MEEHSSGGNFEENPPGSFSNDSSSITDATSNNGNQYFEDFKDRLQEQGKNQDHSPDLENRRRSQHSSNRMNLGEIETSSQPQITLPTTFSACNFNATENPDDNNNVPPLKMSDDLTNSMNFQLDVNPSYCMDRIPSNVPFKSSSKILPVTTHVDMTPTTSSGMNTCTSGTTKKLLPLTKCVPPNPNDPIPPSKSKPTYTERSNDDFTDKADQLEYGCHQRALQPEASHREQVEQKNCSSTLPSFVAYSDREAFYLIKNLRDEDVFKEALCLLITWLENGECNEENSRFFYIMIQSTYSHVERLMMEKLRYTRELNKSKLMIKQQMKNTLQQFNELNKVFNAVRSDKVGERCFTKQERKSIELLGKHVLELRNAHVEDMKWSEDEVDSNVNITAEVPENSRLRYEEEQLKLLEERDTLQLQLASVQCEVMFIRCKAAKEIELKERHMEYLQHAIKNSIMMKNLIQRRMSAEEEIKKKLDEKNQDCVIDPSYMDPTDHFESRNSSLSSDINEVEARLIGLISTFLIAHPFGTSLECICSHLRQADALIQQIDVENLMKKNCTLFREESTGIGASLRKDWTFKGFEP